MRDNPNAATGLALVLLAAIAGGAYYLLVMRQPAPIPPTVSPKAATTWQTIEPRPGQAGTVATDAPRAPKTTSRNRTDTPIKCFDPEVGEFWTNATTCAGADLENTESDLAPHADASSTANTAAGKDGKGANSKGKLTKADRAKYMGEGYLTPEEAAARNHSDQNKQDEDQGR